MPRLPAEVVIDAAHRALDTPFEFGDAHQSARAVSMPGVEKVHLSNDPGHGERFLKLFGKPARLMSSDSERSDETTLGQVFELTSGTTLNHLLQQEDNRIGKLLEAGSADPEIVETLYWATLTRPPSQPEREAAACLPSLVRLRRPPRRAGGHRLEPAECERVHPAKMSQSRS